MTTMWDGWRPEQEKRHPEKPARRIMRKAVNLGVKLSMSTADQKPEEQTKCEACSSGKADLFSLSATATICTCRTDQVTRPST